jgi:cold shock CspA family protein
VAEKENVMETTERHRAIITTETTRGFFFGEDLATHRSIFFHLHDIADARILHAGDLVEFDLVEGRPGRWQGKNVQYVGHNIARQTSASAPEFVNPTGVRHESK